MKRCLRLGAKCARQCKQFLNIVCYFLTCSRKIRFWSDRVRVDILFVWEEQPEEG